MCDRILARLEDILNEAEIDAEINGFRTRPNRPMRAHGSIVKNQRAKYYGELIDKLKESIRKEGEG